MDTEAFKKYVSPHLEAAITANGGIERVRRIYGLMSSVTDFLAGWTCSNVLRGRAMADAFLQRPSGVAVDLTHEEVRRIYDLVRLRISSESSTS